MRSQARVSKSKWIERLGELAAEARADGQVAIATILEATCRAIENGIKDQAAIAIRDFVKARLAYLEGKRNGNS